jgi:hypothetical protein
LKRFLYITPYFPPNNRVGALRPLKFCRHIRNLGWEPLVFCDLKKNDSTDRKLAEFIPDDLVVHRTYSRNAELAWMAFRQGHIPAATSKKSSRIPKKKRFWDNPELIPFGEHLVDIPSAIKNGRKILGHTECDAIVVNIDPHAAGYAGRVLAGESGLPLVLDFRDPWSVCELRRPMRPAPVRKLTDRLEHSMIRRSSAVILNTETALSDYRSHYCDLDPELFTCIRNFGDRELTNHGRKPDLPFKSILFMGNLRRFIDGFEMLDVLRKLKDKGHSSDTLRLVISGQILPETLDRASELGVSDMIHPLDPVPYTEVFPLMSSADILLVIAHRSSQRIPAKFYDYATSGKPILAVSRNEELNHLVRQCGGQAFGFDQTGEMAGYINGVLNSTVDTKPMPHPMFTAHEGSRALARILDRITR